MEYKKDLTIKELLEEMQFLKARLIKLAEQYHRSIIFVSAISYKDIITSGGFKGDIMLNKTIRKEEITNEFDIAKESYNSYRQEAVEKLKTMFKTKTTGECIIYFRDTLKWKWEEISKMFNYSIKQCRRIYRKSKDVPQCPIDFCNNGNVRSYQK